MRSCQGYKDSWLHDTNSHDTFCYTGARHAITEVFGETEQSFLTRPMTLLHKL